MAAMRVENTCACMERKTLMDCSMNMSPLIWLPFLQRDSSRELGRETDACFKSIAALCD
jgi:hypothetical protein